MPDNSPDDALPGPNCIMHHDHVQQMRIDITEIKAAVVGNPKLGHRGLVQRVEVLEQRTDATDRKIVAWSAVLGAAGAAAVFLKDKLLK